MDQKTYPVGIVGEGAYQPAVKATNVGDYVDLVIEQDNPHSQKGIALRVDNMDGDTIGYLPEDHWLYRAIVKEGKGCLARVKSKSGKPVGIVLEARLGNEEVPTLKYGEKLPQSSKGGCMGVLAAIAVGLAYSVSGYIA